MTSTRASARFSTYSGAPSLQPSLASTASSTPSARDRHLLDSALTLVPPAPNKAADVQQWSGTLARMQDARLDRQRYVMSSGKDDEVSTLALTAKLERALARRMSGQDAVYNDARLRRSHPGPAVASARHFDSAAREKAAAAAAALDAEKRACWEMQAANRVG